MRLPSAGKSPALMSLERNGFDKVLYLISTGTFPADNGIGNI